MANQFIGTLLLCLQLFKVHLACGPGSGTSRGRLRDHNIKGNRLPDVPEFSTAASGPFPGAKHRTDPGLVDILSTDIVFKDKSYNANARKSIKTCHSSLKKLAGVVKRFWKNKYKVYVLEGYLPYGKKSLYKHGKHSLHYAGQAFDISLTNSPENTDDRLGEVVPEHTLRTLAGLAYYNAQFTFVQLKKNHLHVSCDSTGHEVSRGRCFSGESSVRTPSKTIAMKDLKIGDSVLTMNPNGQPTFSEVTMMLHKDGTRYVEDFVNIETNSGKSITLSPYHLIQTLETGYVFSKDVKINQTLQTYDDSKNTFQLSQVRNISFDTAGVGIYAPLTNEGTIIVDDVFASCYALFPSHSVSHAVFWVWRQIYPFLANSSEISSKTTQQTYHWYADFLRQSMNYLNIFPYLL
eukprot:TCONS_00002634-protein